MDMTKNRILAVIDPTRDEQWALEKAVSMAKARLGSKVIAYLCVHSSAMSDDAERLQKVELQRSGMWLDRIIAEFADSGVAVEPVIEWHADWRLAISAAAQSLNADLVIKRASSRPYALANSDRQLIRSLRDSWLLLVKQEPVRALNKVLVAIDFNATDRAHTALNEAIIAFGQGIRGSNPDLELHAISAFPSSDRFVHPPDIARTLEIQRSQAHVSRGEAADVIPKMANSIDADLVVVGNVGRRGISGITVGNTAEKILMAINSDVLVLVQETRQDRKAA